MFLTKRQKVINLRILINVSISMFKTSVLFSLLKFKDTQGIFKENIQGKNFIQGKKMHVITQELDLKYIKNSHKAKKKTEGEGREKINRQKS